MSLRCASARQVVGRSAGMRLGKARSTVREVNPNLRGRRVLLRPLTPADFAPWREVRVRNEAWLTRWEPSRPPGSPDVVNDRHVFAARCNARERERHLGSGFGFGVFIEGEFAGEMNLSSVQRGPFQNCYVGYWIDEARAGKGYTPEALVVAMKFAFDDLGLHRARDRDHSSQHGESTCRREAGDPRGGHRGALPGDQRYLGGSRAIRGHR